MATKIGKFHQKIGHYSAYVRDITKILTTSREFSGSACDDHVTARSGVKISKGKGQSATGVF